MSKLNKPLLIKLAGGTTTVAPAVGGTVYAVITQREYESLKTTISTQQAEINSQKSTIKEKDELIEAAKLKPESANAVKDKEQLQQQQGRKIAELNTNLQKVQHELEEAQSKNTIQFDEIKNLKKQLEEKNKEKVPGSEELKKALRKEINKELIELIVDENKDGIVDDRDYGRKQKYPILIESKCDDRTWKTWTCFNVNYLALENGKFKLVPRDQRNKAPSSGQLYDQVNS